MLEMTKHQHFQYATTIASGQLILRFKSLPLLRLINTPWRRPGDARFLFALLRLGLNS
jgi:hypothetical protein